MASDDEIRDRTKRLYQFVGELLHLRHIPVRKCSNYEVYLPLDDLPAKPDCSFIARKDFEEEEETWLEVRCPKIEAYPNPPDVLDDWLDPVQLADASLDMPDLFSGSAPIPSMEGLDAGLDDSVAADPAPEPPSEIKETWEQYVEDKWWPWAERMRPKYRAKKLYDDLFRMFQRQEQLGETYEVVVGFGLLSWRTSEAVELQRHLVTVCLSIELESRRQILYVRPTASGIEAQIEEEMLDPTLRPPNVLRRNIGEELRNPELSLWDGENIHALLEEYCNALSSNARYETSFTAPKTIGTDPVVSFAPALILRKRGNEGMIGLIDSIVRMIESGCEIPDAVLRQVCILDEPPERATGDGPADEEDSETYFPLPANDEQRKIAAHLRTAQGIVVEGPPGTGKSHTIANLICHLLAIGKRVLVTSHKPKALQVLRKMIPEAIRPLCVQALSNDAREMDVLEASVKGITDRHLTWDPAKNAHEIERLEKDLHAARERLQVALHDSRAIREAETYTHERIIAHYSGTLGQIARKLKEEEPSVGFITDEVAMEGAGPHCSVEDFTLMLDVLRDPQGDGASMITDEPPNPEGFPPPAEFDRMVRELGSIEERVKTLDTADKREVPSELNAVASNIREALRRDLANFVTRLRELRRRREPWVMDATAEVLSGRDRRWTELLRSTRPLLESLNAIPAHVLDARITGHESHDLDRLKEHVFALERLMQQRKGRDIRFRSLLPRNVKAALNVLDGVRFDSRPATSLAVLGLLSQWLDAKKHIQALGTQWQGLHNAIDAPLKQQIVEYEDSCEPLSELASLYELSEASANNLREQGLPVPVWPDEKNLDNYLTSFDLADASERLQQTTEEYDGWIRQIRYSVGMSPNKEIQHLFDLAIRERSALAYDKAHAQLSDFREEWHRGNTALATYRSLERTAPTLAHHIKERPDDEKWDCLANRWNDCWAWTIARTWLQEKASPDANRRVSARILEEQQRIRSRLADLASAKAWGHCFDRLTEPQRQSLHAWSNAVRRIGKGKGKYAGQHRLAARQHMAQCRPAIPAWIMPMYRVAESIRPDHVRYDVAIIDEASQSGLEALALLFLADKIVVVGDDKQISPNPFTRVEDANRLRRQYISDLPTSDALGPESSLFDLAKIRYPTRIRLVEHFRCMPEIIQFSNDLCYSTEPLIPLRQYGVGRLEPVINTVFVKKGYKSERQKSNLPEAKAVAIRIAELLRDEQYKDQSFGVISLLGPQHARLIENELLSLVDAKELNDRSLVCGDAYDFQGDERDIMFLSLVIAPGLDKRIPALADPKGRDTRRYNVAMSRARNQIWLFHSVTLNDLNPKDLRARLLRYCMNPQRSQETAAGISLDELEGLSRDADRAMGTQPDPFGSWFEVDVFLRIARRDYTVVPQYDVHGYLIDLALIGHKGKVAVECDGEYWHGPEQWDSDAARQRDLERCGWPFFRLRESTFYLDQEASLEPLWEELKKHGILPRGAQIPDGVSSPDCGQKSETITGFPADAEDAHDTRTEDTHFGQDTSLPPYEVWDPRPVPHPTGSREAVISALCDIVRMEGPMTWRRVFDLYRIGLGLGRLKGPTREGLEAAARHAYRTERLIGWREVESEDWYDGLVRVPEGKAIHLRQRGPRKLEDVAPSEISELLRRHELVDASEERAFRQVLAAYGLRRLTEGVRVHLRAARSIAQKALMPE